ncbi:23S rRNA (pseudouridine(1915)-N(3))-methyltransferase RlmH [Pedobacter flavus]|uniref:Ribosomal RNA large subunit methyltransferase H n=1 Tax=Pedobacter flavus TaxID=3113906 RepID=A0ABU7H1I7_9SPHI|nr:23S rRNA (pseudouridine(1915)-N(3))-methyltransferase RlmH [Pedobacter sp. VNH31]MEE1884927.1 23S rRNA (pseudouridine(1915)-N(3))-methyltransferase RlmH [Pedobacter sp. VNH31]
MKITLIAVGKTEEKYLIEGIEKYFKRLKHYISFQIVIIPDIKNVKNLSQVQQKEKEGISILKHIQNLDTVILLDEEGKNLSSIGFSEQLNKYMNASVQHLVYVIGGPYGFSDAVYNRCNDKLSLSKMTFSHQMVRLFFVEQLYRAFTILRNEPYHHA